MITEAEFLAMGQKLFGPDPMKFRFVCPSCKHIQTAEEYKAAGAPETAVGFSCVGRWLPADFSLNTFGGSGGPCNYAGGGLIGLNPVQLSDRKSRYFEFGPALPEGTRLKMFCLYDHPRDFMRNVVVRPWYVCKDNPSPVPGGPGTEFLTANLDDARKIIPPGLARIPRDFSDDRTIIEVWA